MAALLSFGLWYPSYAADGLFVNSGAFVISETFSKFVSRGKKLPPSGPLAPPSPEGGTEDLTELTRPVDFFGGESRLWIGDLGGIGTRELFVKSPVALFLRLLVVDDLGLASEEIDTLSGSRLIPLFLS